MSHTVQFYPYDWQYDYTSITIPNYLIPRPKKIIPIVDPKEKEERERKEKEEKEQKERKYREIKERVEQSKKEQLEKQLAEKDSKRKKQEASGIYAFENYEQIMNADFENYTKYKFWEYVGMRSGSRDDFLTYYNMELHKVAIQLNGPWIHPDNHSYKYMDMEQIASFPVHRSKSLTITSSIPIFDPEKTIYETLNLSYLRPGKVGITHITQTPKASEFVITENIKEHFLKHISVITQQNPQLFTKWRLVGKTFELVYAKNDGMVFFDDIMLHCFMCAQCKNDFRLNFVVNSNSSTPLSSYLPAKFCCGKTLNEIFKYDIVTITYQFQ